MKSTRKHELQTNELADWLGRQIEFAKPHARTIAYGAAAVIVIGAGLVYYLSTHGSAQEAAAAAFNNAQGKGDIQALRDFVRENPDAVQVTAAKLLLAERLLSEVVGGIKAAPGEDAKAKAASLLAEARDLDEQVAKSSEKFEPMARVGLALVTVQEGNVEKGTAALQEVVQKWPQSIAAAQAKSHLEMLSGYKPVVFSNEPLEKEKPEAKTAEAPKGPEAKPESKPPESPKAPQGEPAAPAPKPAEAPKAAPVPKG